MHGLNSTYGHRAILASAAGLVDERPVWGFVQHGWTPFDGWSYSTHLPARWPRFVWSSASLDRHLSGRPRAPYHVIGSPFAYLLQDGALRPRAGGAALYFPQHSAETASVVGSHGDLAREVREREDGSVRVCLYWLDRTPEVVDAYRREGIEVVSVGTGRADRFFLPRWLRLLDGVGRIASNRLSTAVLYGAALGLEASVYGTRMSVVGAQDDIAPEADSGRRLLSAGGAEEVSVPEAWARRELGFDELLGPDQLRRVLGWSGGRGWAGGSAQAVLDVVRWARRGPAGQSRPDTPPGTASPR